MEEEINIFVRSMDERKEKFVIKPSDSIRTLREAVHQKFGIIIVIISCIEIHLDEIYLLFRGRKLEDTQTISSCKINDGDTILLVKKANPPPRKNFCMNIHFRTVYTGYTVYTVYTVYK